MILRLRDIEKIEEGREEVRQEMREEKNNIIMRMINKNVSIEQIHEFTGYPINEIQQVKDIYIN